MSGLEFRTISLSDKQRIEALLHSAPDRGCEYTFGNLFIWHNVYDTDVAFVGDLCCVRFNKTVNAYLFPFGDGDVKAAIELLCEDAAKRNIPFEMIALRTEDKALLEQLFPDRFSYHPSRDFAEYVYRSQDLIELAGKKYHGKRNHISRFMEENPDYRFEEINRDNIADVKAMNERWYDEILAEYPDDDGLRAERTATANALEHYFELGFSGGFIAIGEEIVAFSMGEPINDKTFCVHMEKAKYDVTGAYTVINRDFAAHFCEKYEFINREDDTGDEGLRRSKLSYYPETVTEKFVVRAL